MPSARAAALARLEPILTAAGLDVIPYAREIPPPETSTVMVRLDGIELGNIAARVYSFALVVLASRTDPGAADDELEDAVEDTLHALETANGFTVGKATRAVYADTVPAFEVPITFQAQRKE